MWDIPLRSVPITVHGGNATAFAVEATHNGGTGARPGKDGLSATAYPSGVWGSQVEITESTEPLRILRRELRPDSGGPGQYRGGLGQVIEVENREGAAMELLAAYERTRYPARGRAGGGDGACGLLSLGSGEAVAPKGVQEIPPRRTADRRNARRRRLRRSLRARAGSGRRRRATRAGLAGTQRPGTTASCATKPARWTSKRPASGAAQHRRVEPEP